MRIRIFKKKSETNIIYKTLNKKRFFIEKSRDVRWSDDIFYWQL